MLVSSRFGLRSLRASRRFSSVAAFDFFFVPPYLTFAVADFRHATTFAVMFVVAVVISGLTQRIRNQAAAARERELRTAALYELSRELAGAQDSRDVIAAAARHIEKVFRSRVSRIHAPARRGRPAYARAHGSAAASERELSIAQWVWANQREAGLGTGTLPGGSDPVRAARRIRRASSACSGLTPDEPQRFEPHRAAAAGRRLRRPNGARHRARQLGGGNRTRRAARSRPSSCAARC